MSEVSGEESCMTLSIYDQEEPKHYIISALCDLSWLQAMRLCPLDYGVHTKCGLRYVMSHSVAEMCSRQ